MEMHGFNWERILIFLVKILPSSVSHLADFVNSQAPPERIVRITCDLLDFSVYGKEIFSVSIYVGLRYFFQEFFSVLYRDNHTNFLCNK